MMSLSVTAYDECVVVPCGEERRVVCSVRDSTSSAREALTRNCCYCCHWCTTLWLLDQIIFSSIPFSPEVTLTTGRLFFFLSTFVCYRTGQLKHFGASSTLLPLDFFIIIFFSLNLPLCFLLQLSNSLLASPQPLCNNK